MHDLRAPGGCPWDRRQTHESLRPYLIEETYEAADAIDRGDLDALTAELGDVLLQVVFHAELGREAGRFTIEDVIEAIATKLITRHPHVFTPDGRRLPRGRTHVKTPGAVAEQWERIKRREQHTAGTPTGLLTGVPRALPALLRAHKISSRAASVGFEWDRPADVMDKVEEEVRELREALTESEGRAREELGDLLFSLANLARKLRLEPEAALSRANDKFTARFQAMEHWLARRGRDVHAASLEEMEAAWTAIKKAPATPARARSGRTSPRRPTSARRSRR
jgi:MazG family protein